jgi:HSP20 family protein
MNWWNLSPRQTGLATTPALSRMRTEFDRAFDRFFRDAPAVGWVEDAEGWLPSVEIKDSETDYVIKAEIPGVAAKDVNVSLCGNSLCISGEKDESREEKEGQSFFCERRFGAFRRTVPLPDGFDPDKVAAEQDNGVLTVRVGKLKATKPRQISVRPAAK